MRIRSIAAAGIAAIMPGTLHAASTPVFFQTGQAVTSGVGRIDPGTNTRQLLMSFSQQAVGVTAHEGFVYASAYNTGEIWRCGLNGESPTLLLSRGPDRYVRQIQFKDNQMYWNEEGNGGIYRANLDGSGVTHVMTIPGGASGIWDFTLANERVYWTSWQSAVVSSTRLDGTDLRTFDAGFRAFCIESFEGGLVVGSFASMGLGTNAVRRMNFDGTNAVTLAAVPVQGLSIFEGNVYYGWAAGANQGLIASTPLTGGAQVVHYTGVSTTFQLSVIPAPSTLAPVAAAVLAVSGRRRRRGA
jgi:hypothetical protein